MLAHSSDKRPKSNPTTGDIHGSTNPPNTTRVRWSDMQKMGRGWILTMRCGGGGLGAMDDVGTTEWCKQIFLVRQIALDSII